MIRWGEGGLRWYSLMWGLSVLLSYFVAQYMFRKNKWNQRHVIILGQYLLIGGLIGARLVHVLFYDLPYFLERPLEIFMIWKGGLASHGGVIGNFIALYLFSNKYQYNPWKVLDVLAVGASLIGGLIRIGNFFNSELYGTHTDLTWGVVFRTADLQPRHPTQLYEAFMIFGVFLFLFYCYHRFPKWKPGTLMALFLIIAPTGRIIIEFWKEDAVMTQLLSVPLIVLGVGMLVFRGWKTTGH